MTITVRAFDRLCSMQVGYSHANSHTHKPCATQHKAMHYIQTHQAPSDVRVCYWRPVNLLAPEMNECKQTTSVCIMPMMCICEPGNLIMVSQKPASSVAPIHVIDCVHRNMLDNTTFKCPEHGHGARDDTCCGFKGSHITRLMNNKECRSVFRGHFS